MIRESRKAYGAELEVDQGGKQAIRAVSLFRDRLINKEAGRAVHHPEKITGDGITCSGARGNRKGIRQQRGIFSIADTGRNVRKTFCIYMTTYIPHRIYERIPRPV